MINDEETPAEFLKRLGQEMIAKDSEDTELAKIIAEHILTTEPSDDCVMQSMAAIKDLASSRATPPEKEGEDG